MRTLFLLLLLANLLFAGWAYWVAPARAPADGRPTPSSAETSRIRLLHEAPVSLASMPRVDGDVDPADAAVRCVSVGPYLERTQAEQVEARLARLGFTVRLRVSREEVGIGDWVRIENLATPEDAANALAQLQAAGIGDAYVLADESPGTVISLGVFTDPERAEQAEIIARMAGFEPSTVERTRDADVAWLDIDRQASGGLPALEQLDGASQRPALRLRPCPDPGATASVP